MAPHSSTSSPQVIAQACKKKSYTMSTATNLLSLLNQLQLMENSLTNFMLETILKIQTLTETKVFLLLESSGGADSVRRFCGTSDLVESFENGRLNFRSTDV